MINGSNSTISSLCKMLKLAKGTQILGLTKTGSHGTISQYFFGSYPEREFINDPPIHNAKQKSKELTEQMYEKLFTQLLIYSFRLITHNSRDPPPKKIIIKATTKHYYV